MPNFTPIIWLSTTTYCLSKLQVLTWLKVYFRCYFDVVINYLIASQRYSRCTFPYHVKMSVPWTTPAILVLNYNSKYLARFNLSSKRVGRSGQTCTTLKKKCWTDDSLDKLIHPNSLLRFVPSYKLQNSFFPVTSWRKWVLSLIHNVLVIFSYSSCFQT